MAQVQRSALSITDNANDHEIIDTPLLQQPMDEQIREEDGPPEHNTTSKSSSSVQQKHHEEQKAFEIESEEEQQQQQQQPIAGIFIANNNNDSTTTKLPIPLLLLFGLYGLTMSLPTLPLMYILNTRVALPLSILPTYGALSFLPYSFKPLYAYWSSHFSRRRILCIGWSLCALTSVGWTWVQTTPWVFIMGISNGVAMAWSGFLLGLTLLDQAATRQQQQQQQQQHPEIVSYASPQEASDSSNTNNNGTFEKAASLFQSQAATARNVGSFAASILTCIIFGLSHAQSKMNNQVTNALLLATAGCHGISFMVVFSCRKTFAPNEDDSSSNTRPYYDDINDDESQSSQSPTNSLTGGSRPPSPPSYSSIELYLGDEEEEGEEELPESDTTRPTSRVVNQTPPSPPPSLISASDNTLPWDKNVILIGTLQVSVIVLALKGPILDLISHHPNLGPILGVTACLTVALLAARLYYVSTSSSTPWKLSHMVGLILMLRHAIPSTSSILGAFLYQCLKDQPVWLQIFSLVDNGVTTLSSWSYQKLWATRYSHGRKLIHFMMVTTIVASMADYLYVILVRYYDDDDDEDSTPLDDGDEETVIGGTTSSSKMQSIFPWLVLVVKVVDTFIGEWNFIPDVVLATVSVTVSTPAETVSDTRANTTTDLVDEEGLHRPPQAPLAPPMVAPAAAGVEYGSLISCIDFGDQLGTILATPIVSLLGITRENGWNHLDLMIQICTGLGVLSVGFLTILLWWFPRDDSVASASYTRSQRP